MDGEANEPSTPVTAEQPDPSGTSGPSPEGSARGAQLEGPSPPLSRRARWGIVGAVIVAVIVVVALTQFTPLGTELHIPGSPPAGGSSGGPSTFSQAFAIANALAQSEPGGPWGLVSATGVATPNASAPFEGETGNASCPFPSVPGAPATATAALLAGQAVLWIFSFQGPSGGSTTVAVVSGFGTVVENYGAGSICAGRVFGTLPSADNIEDSSQFVSSLQPRLGAFVGNYSDVGAYFALSDEGGAIGSQSGTAFWAAIFTPCSDNLFSATNTPGNPLWYGGSNATNDTVLLDRGGPGVGSCATAGSLAISLSYPAVVQNSTGSTYSFPFHSAAGDFTAGSIRPGVVDKWDVPDAGAVNCTLEGSRGESLAVFNFATGEWTGASTLLSGVTSLVLFSTTDLVQDGAALVLRTTTGPVTGTVLYV